MLNKETKKRLVFYLATRLAWRLILFFGKTARITLRNRAYWDELENSSRGSLLLVWHGKMMLPIYVMRSMRIVAMVSEHSDGEMLAQTVHRLGYKTVRGSSTRGGMKAFRKLLKALKQGEIGTLLPDGPNGPRQVLKKGSILLAQRAGVPILPITFAAEHPIVFNSWDRFTLWRPFSRVVLLYGKPIVIPRDLDETELEAHRQAVEDAMKQLERDADAIF